MRHLQQLQIWPQLALVPKSATLQHFLISKMSFNQICPSFQCTLYKKQQGLFERLVQVYPQHASCINFVHLATKWHQIGSKFGHQMAPSQVPRPTRDFQVSWGGEEQRADPPFWCLDNGPGDDAAEKRPNPRPTHSIVKIWSRKARETFPGALICYSYFLLLVHIIAVQCRYIHWWWRATVSNVIHIWLNIVRGSG